MSRRARRSTHSFHRIVTQLAIDIASSSKAADELIRLLKENSQMYNTQVVDREAWYVPFIAPKDKSVSWWLISLVIISTFSFFVLLYLKGLVEDPEFRKNFMDAIKTMKG